MANLSRRHVGCKLAAFEAQCWIRCAYNRIGLLNVEGMATFAYGATDA